MDYIITFNSTAHAMRAESVLLDNNLVIEVASIPSEISSGCGICIYFNDLDSCKKTIDENDILYSNIFCILDNYSVL